MTVWPVASTSEEPSTAMNSWSIAEITWPDAKVSYHVVGYCYEGRVSSGIQKWDSTTRIATTQSGRNYLLPDDAAGWNSDSDYVFSIWLQRNGATRDMVKWVKEPLVDQESQSQK